VHDIGGDLSQRHQNKSPLAHTRMRDGQLGRFQNQVVVEQDVQINGARGITKAGLSSHLPFNLLQEEEQILG